MKTIAFLLCAICCGNLVAQSDIVAAEYFVNDDPGLGNGTEIDVSAGNALSVAFDVPVAGLDAGMNILHVRAQDNASKWGLYARKSFYIINIQQPSPITAAEYFFGNDPGPGAATGIDVSAGNSVSESFAIPVDDLEPGAHVLHIRVQDELGRWGMYARKMLLVQPAFIDHEIVAMEYFIDSDPGNGNGNPLEFTAGTEVSEIFNVDVPDTLSEGDHLMNIRVKNDAGKWSIAASNIFTIQTDVGMDNAETTIEIYPNPTSGIIYLNIEEPVESILLLDIKGRIVISPDLRSSQLDMRNLPAGVYLLQLETKSSKISKRIVRQ